MYNKSEKFAVCISVVLTMVLLFPTNAGAMHIMEGFLPIGWSIGWGVVTIPFLVCAFISINKKLKENQKNIVLLALCGAFAFVLSALKIPSVTGSCSHPTGVGLGAILFGPFVMSIISVIILLFQALLLAHGGLTTLGANTFSMGVVGPILSFVIYRFMRKLKINTSVAVFCAALIGNLATYTVTSVQLALAYPSGGSVLTSLAEFLSIFALTQIPLAVCEGIVTVVVFGILEKYNKNQLVELNVISQKGGV